MCAQKKSVSSSILEWEHLLCDEPERLYKKDGKFVEKNDDRNIFKRDFDQICFWSSFRRLQDKAQVFPLEEGDYSRTRLTHSIEVTSIAEAFGEHMINLIIKDERNKQKQKLRSIYPKEPQKVKNIMDVDYLFSNAQKWLEKSYYDKINAIPMILRSASLIHDLGNPPYGHISEKTISKWFILNLHKFKFETTPKKTLVKTDMPIHEKCDSGDSYLSLIIGKELCEDFYAFDGNAELLRIVRKLQNISPGRINSPVNLSYPLIATTIKYPTGFLQKRYPDDKSKWNKKNFFNSEKEYYNTLQEVLHLNNNRHPLAFLLEAADDTAYLVSDLEDAMFKGLIDVEDIRKIVKLTNESEVLKLVEMGLIKSEDEDKFKNMLSKSKDMSHLALAIDEYIKNESFNVAIKKICGRFRGYFISRIKNEMEIEYPKMMEGTYYGNLIETSSAEFVAKCISELLKKKVYYSRDVIEKKIEGINSINTMLNSFIPAVFNAFEGEAEDSFDYINSRLISTNFMELCEARLADIKEDKYRYYELLLLIVDYISGMTDTFASKVYKVLK